MFIIILIEVVQMLYYDEIVTILHDQGSLIIKTYYDII